MFLIFSCILFAVFAQETSAECPPIIKRKEWDAAKALHTDYLNLPVDLVVIQHTVTQSCTNDQSCAEIVRGLQKTHIEDAYLWDIGSSFLVGGTGKLYEGRGWHHVAIHTPGYNNQSIGIAFIGNFNNQEPSPKALKVVQDLIQCGVEEGKITKNHKVVVHSQLLSTESPGKKLASKIMTWSDWINDVTDIKKQADKQEKQTLDPHIRSERSLALTTPKQIDLLSNLRDVIAELIQNMSKLAHGTVDTIAALTKGLHKEGSLFVETILSELKKFRDQLAAQFNAVSVIPGAQNCANSLKKKSDTIYDNTETKAKKCADQRIKEIEDMINNLAALSSNAIDYTNTAVESTKNCTELNAGIEGPTKACLNSVTKQTETASKTYESQRTTQLNSINTQLSTLPSALDLCAKQHISEAGAETSKILAEFPKCSSEISVPSFGGFGFKG